MISQHIPHFEQLITLTKDKRNQIFLIGGFLRDLYLENRPSDLDFVVRKQALPFAQDFAHSIKGAYIVLDEKRACARVVKKIKGAVYTFDFAQIQGSSMQEDIQHRDFTINTLYVDLKEAGKVSIYDLTDGFPKAKKDLDKGKIKRVTAMSFKEDPLRMLRAFSLKAVLGFKIEVSTLNQIRRDKDRIQEISAERITEEFFKILEINEAASILKSMDKAGLLEVILPQIKVMYDCKQGAYHHLDVWPHSMDAVVQLERLYYQHRKNTDIEDYLNQPVSKKRTRKALLKLATLLHDIGKPDTRMKDAEGALSFHGHEHVGARIVHTIARQWKLSVRERKFLEDMVAYHLRPGYLSNYKKPGDRMVYRFFRDTRQEAVGILLMSIADQRATRGPLTTDKEHQHHEHLCLALIKTFFEKQKEQPYVPLITGHELLRKFQLTSSPLIGKILEKVKEQYVLGKIQTKKEAYSIGKDILNHEG